MAKRVKLQEGELFLVPVGTGSYALGLITRLTMRYKIPLGYFFGQMLSYPDTNPDVTDIRPGAEILIREFGTQGFAEGTWLKIGVLPGFDRVQWPVPVFVDTLSLLAPRLVFLDDNLELVRYGPIPEGKSPGDYYEHGLSGSAALEIRLTKILRGEP